MSTDMTMEVLGWITASASIAKAIPQARKSFKDGHSHGLTWGLLLFWSFQIVSGGAYTYYKETYPLTANCAFNLIMVMIMLYYKINPKENSICPKKKVL